MQSFSELVLADRDRAEELLARFDDAIGDPVLSVLSSLSVDEDTAELDEIDKAAFLDSNEEGEWVSSDEIRRLLSSG